MMNAVVMDNGTNSSKIGFNEEDNPALVIPTTILVHDDIQTSIVRKGGVHIDFDALALFWDKAFGSLHIDPVEYSVFLSEAPLLPIQNRARKAEILFETFQVKSLFVSPEGVLPLYAAGEVSGTVIDLGAGHTHVTSIFDSHIIKSSLARYELSGNDITQYLTELVELKYGFIFKSSFRNIQSTIKESLCYVAQDYDQELNLATNSTILEESFALPDGNIVKLNEERFKVPEIMFQPSLAYRGYPGIHHMIQSSIMNSDIDTRRSLCQHIILSGGSTMFPGLEHRLQNEVKALFPAAVDINIVAPDDRNLSVWIGGAVLSSLSSFQSSWVTKAVYEEKGSSILYGCS
jgi:actin, other eukaryote